MRTFSILALVGILSSAEAVAVHHRHHHHQADEALLDTENAPFSLPFHTTLPLSDSYKKSIKEAEEEANKLRKAYNEAQEDADEKQRLWRFKADEAKFSRGVAAKAMDELRYVAKQAK